MTAPTTKGKGGGFSSQMEEEARRRLFPVSYFESHLGNSKRLDGRPLDGARDTSIGLGAVSTADGSALVKIGDTTMVAAIKLEVMSPSSESPDEGALAIDFHMPPICSPTVRPGRPAEIAPVISKQLTDVILSSGMINLKELSLISEKSAWMAYLDVYCLNADGSLFDTALLSVVAAFSQLEIPLVSLNDDGRIIAVSGEDPKGKSRKEFVNKEKRKLCLGSLPLSLTCILYKQYILPDPIAEEESITDNHVTVVLDTKGQLVSVNKPGGAVLASTLTLRKCIELTRHRVKELQNILDDALSPMQVD